MAAVRVLQSMDVGRHPVEWVSDSEETGMTENCRSVILETSQDVEMTTDQFVHRRLGVIAFATSIEVVETELQTVTMVGEEVAQDLPVMVVL